VFRQPGALPANVFEQLIGEVRKLDMDDVRRQIAEKDGQAGEDAAGADAASE